MFNYIIWILTIILYSPILYQLYRSRWEIIDYTHAYFILPISLWLVFRKREQLKEILQKVATHKNLLSISVMILGVLMFIFGWRRDYLFISSLSSIPFLIGLISYIYGIEIFKALSFPILYLLLLVPPPLGILDSITLPMRHGISVLTEIILKVFHYPITRDGLLLSFGGHEIFMGAPCSGFRSLITMFSLALVYVYINKGTFAKKTILILSIIPLTLFGNLVRVIILCLITYYLGEKIAQGFFHYLSGAVIFVILIIGLIGLESLLDRLMNKTKT